MWGAAPPDPSPGGRADGAGAEAASAGRPRGRGARGGAAGASPTSRDPGPPRAGRGTGACRDSPFVPRRLGRGGGGRRALSSLGRDGDGGFPARAPPPRARPPQLPRALRLRRRLLRLLLRPLGLPSCSRSGGGGGGGSPSPGAGQARALGAEGRRGPLAIRPGAPRARAPLHFLLGVAAAARPETGERLGEGSSAGVGLQAVSHGHPCPAAVRTPSAPPGLAPPPRRPPPR